MGDAEKQIDDMAKQGQIDPAFLFTMAKAYSGVKETDYTKDDVKETMAHLYMKAKEAAARDSPAEVRILKHLLMIDDPAHRSKELERAFEPVRRRCCCRICARLRALPPLPRCKSASAPGACARTCVAPPRPRSWRLFCWVGDRPDAVPPVSVCKWMAPNSRKACRAQT